MITCKALLKAADVVVVTGNSQSPDDVITLDETDRHRRRMRMISDGGITFLLDLENTTLLREGDRLLLSDGRSIEVRAEPEALYEVRARDAHQLLMLSWHLGNRHLPTQILSDHLRIRHDAVIGDMLRGLGGIVTEVMAGFDPEGGAYGDAGHAHGHEHSHDHQPEHSHEHGHEHGHHHGS